ncbi:MAG: signal peptidase I [Atopobiaceae bacterium]|nr:signal peptidase I [Atopobiaceae bacterium]
MKKRKTPKWLPGFCRVAGIMLLVVVIGLCAPITIPRIFGYEVYDVVSGSMEPEIPVGSVLYVKACDLQTVNEGDVIAYSDVDGVVAHRVVKNRTGLGEFVTKGDANNVEDRKPVSYERVVGRVELHLPLFGMGIALYASPVGKVYLLMTAGCGLMLWLLADRLEETT